jgi:hypothetical protein
VGIAGLLGIHPNTLYEACKEKYNLSFSEYSAQKKAEGKELLRAKQFQVAMEGDKTMLVWLGKQHLGQKDKSDVTSDDKAINSDLKIVVDSKDTEKELKEFFHDTHSN